MDFAGDLIDSTAILIFVKNETVRSRILFAISHFRVLNIRNKRNNRILFLLSRLEDWIFDFHCARFVVVVACHDVTL
jgi:hypothetical protein